MSLSFGGSKQKQQQSQSQTTNETSRFTPDQSVVDMTNSGLARTLGLVGGYQRTSPQDIAGFLNPMQDTINAGVQRQARIAGNSVDGQAAAAGAFGGSGWGLLRGETERAYADATAQATAQGYGTALNAAMGDNQNASAYDLNAIQTYLQGLGLMGNWGTTNATGTSSGTSKGSGSKMGFEAGFKYGGK